MIFWSVRSMSSVGTNQIPAKSFVVLNMYLLIILWGTN